MTTVIAATLPVLNQLPSNWRAVTAAYEQAREDALVWTNEVYAQLQETPDEVADKNDIISKVLADAIIQAQTLIASPSDSTAKNLLNADLKSLKNKFTIVNTFISDCISTFNQFGYATLPDAANQLLAVSNEAYEDYKIDKQKIEEYQKQIDDLKAEITQLAISIGINSGAIAVELTLGVAYCAETGGISLLVAGFAIAASATFIGLDAEQLKEDQADLITLHAEMDSTTQDAASLQSTADTYKLLADQITALGTSVDEISSAWNAVEADITTAIDDLTNAVSDVGFDDFQSVYNDLVDAQTAWNNTYAATQLLQVNILGNTANLTIGMTSADVAGQIQANMSIDFVVYINNFPEYSANAAGLESG
jgi:chromosome segregation ATPase